MLLEHISQQLSAFFPPSAIHFIKYICAHVRKYFAHAFCDFYHFTIYYTYLYFCDAYSASLSVSTVCVVLQCRLMPLIYAKITFLPIMSVIVDVNLIFFLLLHIQQYILTSTVCCFFFVFLVIAIKVVRLKIIVAQTKQCLA